MTSTTNKSTLNRTLKSTVRIIAVLFLASAVVFAQLPFPTSGGSGGGSISSSCAKNTIPYTSLTAAGTTQNMTLLTLPARAKIFGLTIKPSVSFTAAGLQKLTMSLGTTTDAIAYTPALSIHTPIINGNVTSDAAATATVNTTVAHNLVVGDRAVLSSCATAGFNGDWPIASTPTTTSFTIINTGVINGNSAGCVLSTVSPLPPSMYDDGGFFSASFNSHAMVAYFTSTGVNLNTLTAGSVDVWVCSLVLP